MNSGCTPNATIDSALARAVRYARFSRRRAVIPVASGSASEFPKRLKFREIVCDVHYVEVPTVVCNVA